jgi:hypothetical protein
MGSGNFIKIPQILLRYGKSIIAVTGQEYEEGPDIVELCVEF